MMPEIVAALPMVAVYARRYRRTPLGYDDAAGTGSLALVEAASAFDPARGVPFAAYAAKRVRGAMIDAHCCLRGTRAHPNSVVFIEDERDETRLSVEPPLCDGTDMHRAIERLDDPERKVVLMLAAGYSSREIADQCGVSESRISQRLHHARKCLQETSM